MYLISYPDSYSNTSKRFLNIIPNMIFLPLFSIVHCAPPCSDRFAPHGTPNVCAGTDRREVGEETCLTVNDVLVLSIHINIRTNKSIYLSFLDVLSSTAQKLQKKSAFFESWLLWRLQTWQWSFLVTMARHWVSYHVTIIRSPYLYWVKRYRGVHMTRHGRLAPLSPTSFPIQIHIRIVLNHFWESSPTWFFSFFL